MRSKKLTRHVLLAACALLLGACSGFTVPDLDEEVKAEKIIPPDWTPVKLSVGLAPVAANLELDAAKLNVEKTRRWVLAPDGARLNSAENSIFGQWQKLLSRYRMFSRVEPIKGVNADSTIEEISAQALLQGFDVVLRPVVRRSDVGYVGTNSAYGWNLAMWLVLSPINSWWVADEEFDAFLDLDFDFYSAANGKLLRNKRIKPQKPVIKAFDDWDMGFNLFAIFTAPNYFDHENWEKIGGKIMPFADQATKKQSLRYIVNEFSGEARSDAFQAGIRRRVGLFIGVDGNGQNGVPLTRFAAEDARGLASSLTVMPLDPLAQGASLAITDEHASSRGVFEEIDKLTRIARENDDFFLGYSGMGTLTPEGKPAVLLRKNEGGYEAMALETLVDRALANKPRTLVLTLDCSFLAPSNARCAADAKLIAKLEGAPQESILKPLIARCEKAGTKCIILSATTAAPARGGEDHALELEDLGHGLFTSFLIDGLNGGADADGIGGVSVEELMAWLAPSVSRIAGFDNKLQKPEHFASEARKGYLLPSAGRAASER